MKTMHILICLTLLSFLGLGCGLFNGGEVETGTMTDIDGNIYTTVKIGDQWWMAENLKTTQYRDGTAIPNVTVNATWAGLSTGAYCTYNNDGSSESDTYGYLYNWYAVNGDGTKELAPTGWRVATDDDWKALEMHLGMSQITADLTSWRGTDEGTRLKSTSGWDNDGNGPDWVGFSALPGGFRDFNDGGFYNMGLAAGFWSTSEHDATSAWRRVLLYDNVAVHRNKGSKGDGFSVRCVKD